MITPAFDGSSTKNAEALGARYEKECTGCAQSTLAAVLDALGVQSEDAFMAASGLADGIGLSGDGSCGALTGGSMTIGLLFGRDRAHFEDPLAAMDSYLMARELLDHFIASYGSCRCHDIQIRLMGRSFDLMDPDQFSLAIEMDMPGHCSQVVGVSAAKTVEIIGRGLGSPAPGKEPNHA